MGENERNTYPQPCGVTSPKAQSPLTLATTWFRKTGVMTTPALAPYAAARAMATKESFIFGFLFVDMCII